MNSFLVLIIHQEPQNPTSNNDPESEEHNPDLSMYPALDCYLIQYWNTIRPWSRLPWWNFESRWWRGRGSTWPRKWTRHCWWQCSWGWWQYSISRDCKLGGPPDCSKFHSWSPKCKSGQWEAWCRNFAQAPEPHCKGKYYLHCDVTESPSPSCRSFTQNG